MHGIAIGNRRSGRGFLLPVMALAAGALSAQTANRPAPLDPNLSAQRALQLAEQGRCGEALPIFQRVVPRLTVGQQLYRTAMGQARCAMAREDAATAVSALMLLRSRFPDDPEVLFVCVHYFSQLAMRTSRELAAKAPTSFQARRLEAEAYESAGKWEEAIGIYRGILKDSPKEPAVHYRIGQALLNRAGDSGPFDDARSEFQREIEINPRDAAAEFVLGELARRTGNLEEAAAHFRRASEADTEFAEAFIALGVSLTTAAKYTEAVAPLETYVKMQPDDPLGHYQLALAYGRTGNREGAQREVAAQKATAAKRQLERGDGRTRERTVH